MTKKKRHYKRKQPKLDDITKFTIDASKMVIGTSASLAIMKGATEALKR